ncbi:hypothetical protein LXL04_024556 [Taraxacum kok-saghyz]
MDEIWERAVETALDGQTDVASVRTLTLDGAVKCVHGRLPHPSLFQKFPHLQHLSIANIGVSSLEQFPRLQNLQKLILSDNRIAGGLEFLVHAGLDSLRDLDLSNNRIQEIDDLRPLAELRLVSLDLYECPVTRVKDYRSRVFGLIKSLKYLDKMDVDENERPESDDEDDDDEDEEDDEEEEEDDPGSGEIDGEEKGPNRLANGHTIGQDGVVDVDEDDESDADEEEAEIVRGSNGNASSSLAGQTNGFHAESVDVEDDDDDGDDDNDSDEIDEEVEEEEDVVEVHEIEDSDDEEDGVEDDDEEDDDEEVDNEDVAEPGSTGWLTSTEGEIDGHEQGEEDGDEDDDGETGEEEVGVEEADFEDDEEAEDEEEDEDVGTGYLVQPVAQVAEDGVTGDEEDDPEVEEEEDEDDDEDANEDDDDDVGEVPPSSSSKRKRDGDDGGDDDDDDDDDQLPKSSKQK